eukprot:gene15842-18676_t
MSDHFLIEFTQVETGDYVRKSTAIDIIKATGVSSGVSGHFRLSCGGRTTDAIPSSVSGAGLEAILESLFDYQLNVTVSKEVDVDGATMDTTWTVEFLTMLDVWSTESGKLTLVAPVDTSDAFYPTMTLYRPASQGVYPASFTLWHIGAYTVRISSEGRDIQGSPATIFVSNAPVDPTASIATGNGLVGGVAG